MQTGSVHTRLAAHGQVTGERTGSVTVPYGQKRVASMARSVGPYIVTVGTPTALARCIGPVDTLTKSRAWASTAANWRRSRAPARETGLPSIPEITRFTSSFSFAVPVTATNQPRRARPVPTSL